MEREDGASLQDIEDELYAGHKVIAGVNGEEIWAAAHPGGGALPVGSYPGIPGQPADHAVEVIGIDASNPAAPMVVLNDSGTPDGRGLEVPVETFQRAWSTSGDFMVHTLDPGTPSGGSTMQTSGQLRVGEWVTVPVYDEGGNHIADSSVYRETP